MFVDRENGAIVAVYATAQREDQESVAENDTDLLAFMERIANPVPSISSAGDFMRALYELGWYDDVSAAVQGAGSLAKILWERAASFERRHPLVGQIAQAIGKTDADLDDLFRKAASYNT